MAVHTPHHPSVIEAVETLSNIADLEFDHDVGITKKHQLILAQTKITYKTVHWLHKKDASSTIHVLKETFRVVLHYLKQFYKNEYGHVTNPETIDGLKNIMALVKDAAKKLDKYASIYDHKHSVTEFKEFIDLHEFYRTKIARKQETNLLNKWVLGLSLKNTPKKIPFAPPSLQAKKILKIKNDFVDFETVKKDTEYELLFIRKEDGSRFFSPRLLRNIKLVCDFENYFGKRKELNPLDSIKQWQDRLLHSCCRDLIKALGPSIGQFFRESKKIKDHGIVEKLNKALLALMLGSHAQNLMKHNPVKCCLEYFEDFQKFLRAALHTPTYKKWIASPPKDSHPYAHDLVELIQNICKALYFNIQGIEETAHIIQDLIKKAEMFGFRQSIEKALQEKKVCDHLSIDYLALSKLLQKHPNGPLLKVLTMLEEENYNAYDPLLLHNVSNQLFDLYFNNSRCSFIRIPAPVYQEFIHTAEINEEFKACMRQFASLSHPRKHLLINLQDRTSWREHARSAALEEMQSQKEFEKTLIVATFAIDTDFYQQLNPYHEVNQAQLFLEQFKEIILDENTGYYFPSVINKKELAAFINDSLQATHQIFFSNKNVLTRENRLDFIEIIHLLLQLKLIEWCKPDSVSLTCKDCIDIGPAYSAACFAFIKLINTQNWSAEEWQHLNFMLYTPSILMRERIMLPERFNRTLGALRTIENTRDEQGPGLFIQNTTKYFNQLFHQPIWQADIRLQKK